MSDNDEQAVDITVDAGSTVTESPTVEPAPEVAEEPSVQRDNGELNLKADTEEQPVQEETQEEAPAEQTEETESEEQPQDTEPELAPKSQNRFQQLANERNEYKRQLDEYRAREARIAQEQALTEEINPETGDYYTPQEIERLAFAQSKQAEAQQVAEQRYELEVQDVQFQLRDEATRALTDFPMFDEDNKAAYDPELAAEVDQMLGANLVFEEGTGRIIGSRVSPYQIYQTVYRAHEKAQQKGQINGQRATERMLASVDGTSSNQKGDVSFDKLSTAEMQERLRKAGHDV